MDTPAETLYWTLRHGQRRRIAEYFGVCRAADLGMGELPAAKLWLKRLADCGSVGRALDRARQWHLDDLRQIEDTIRHAGAVGWRAELESWRDHHYRLLALTIDGEP